MRLIDALFHFLGRRGSRARGRLVYRMLFDVAAPERAAPIERKAETR